MNHQIWEVGLILPDGSEHSWQLPVDLSRADPIALNIGRFHERRLAPVGQLGRQRTRDSTTSTWTDYLPEGGYRLTTLATFCSEFVALTRGLHMAGAGVSFDAERLWKLLRANGECPMWHYHLVDVEALAAGGIAATRRAVVKADGPVKDYPTTDPSPPWNSNDLSRAVGVEPDDFDRHTALGDARWAKAIYEAVMGS